MSENTIQPELKKSLPPVTLADGTQVEYQFEGDTAFVEPQPGFRIYSETFGGSLAGLAYHYPQFENDENPAAAVEAALGKYGVEKVLNLINTCLKNFTTAKVRNSKVKALEVLNEKGEVDTDATEKALANVRQNNPLLFTVQEAIDYSPMQREETLNTLYKKAAACNKKGDFDGAMKFMAQVMEKMKSQQALAEAAKA